MNVIPRLMRQDAGYRHIRFLVFVRVVVWHGAFYWLFGLGWGLKWNVWRRGMRYELGICIYFFDDGGIEMGCFFSDGWCGMKTGERYQVDFLALTTPLVLS